MCLIVYSDVLPRMIHDSIMSCLETPVGQQADNFADALHRTLMADGRNILEVIHKEGFMKKVATSQIIMNPHPQSKIRLDELNTLLTEMSKGEEAIKRMAEIDNSTGMQKRNNTPARNVGEPAKVDQNKFQSSSPTALSDEDIAKQQLSQAAKMRMEASSLLAEATRLEIDSAKFVSQTTLTSDDQIITKTIKNADSQETKKVKV